MTINLIKAINIIGTVQMAVQVPAPMSMVDVHDASALLGEGLALLNASEDATTEMFNAATRCATALKLRALAC
jgi:hypothetical protein